MKKPTELFILGRKHNVIYLDNIEDVSQNTEERYWGCINYEKREIRIYNGLTDEDTIHTLMHEIGHGISQLLGLNLKERDIDLLSLGYADLLIKGDFIKLNP